MTVYLAGKKNLKALRVDLMLTVESPKSKNVSCDAMTNVGSCPVLMRTADVDVESNRRDCRYYIVEVH